MNVAQAAACIPPHVSAADRPSYLRGLLAGLENRRPAELSQEEQFLGVLDEKLGFPGVISDDSPLLLGARHGISIRIDAERAAANLYRSLSGALPGITTKRLFARGRECRRLLHGLPLEVILILEETYYARYHQDLVELLEQVFLSPMREDLILLIRDPKLRLGLHEEGTSGGAVSDEVEALRRSLAPRSKNWAGKFFLGKDGKARKTLVEQFELRHGPLVPLIHRSLRGWDREFALDLIERGFVHWGKLLFFCVVGVGTDEAGLFDLLERMRADEITAARAEFSRVWRERAPWYQRPFPHIFGDLQRRIWIETGGDSWFDLQEYFCAAASSTDDLHTQLERFYAHERSGILLKRLDFFSREGSLMNKDVGNVRAFYEAFVRGKAVTTPTRLRFRALVHYAELDCEIFRALKHFVGNVTTNAVAGISVAASAYALSTQRFELETIMVTVALVSMALRLALKTMLKGRAYHWEELGVDMFFGCFDGMTLYTAQLFRLSILRLVAKVGAKLGFSKGIMQFSRLLGEGRAAHLGVKIVDLGG